MKTWRPADEDLLKRLEDERRFSLLWESYAQDPHSNELEPPNTRAAGVLSQLRQTTAGAEAVAGIDDGGFAPTYALIERSSYANLSPELLHHLALLHEDLAALRPAHAPTHLLHGLACWVGLGRERRYLIRLAGQVAPEVNAADRDILIEAACLGVLTRLGERAREDAERRGPMARLALTVILRLNELEMLLAKSNGDLSKEDNGRFVPERLGLEARMLKDELLELAIAPHEHALEEARSHEVGKSQVVHLVDLSAVADWADGARLVDHRVLDLALPVSWSLYKTKKMDLLTDLVAGTRNTVDRSIHRILTDPSEVSQASRTAQMLVFRAEATSVLDKQVRAIETALKVCPTHRNARAVGADVFVYRAQQVLRGAAPFSRGTAVKAAITDGVRARDLWPSCSRLASLEEALARLGHRLPPETDDDAEDVADHDADHDADHLADHVADHLGGKKK